MEHRPDVSLHADQERQRLEYQKWDYIELSDFRSRSSWNWVSYVWLWILALIAVSVYASDTYTAVNLLAFDNWSSQIKPKIPFYISKWIFAGCILFSWVLCIYEWIRALRVMKRGNVAESYLDPLAVVLNSMRLGGVGKGWRRFLVFSALTKSKKGADYVALFAYFQFKGAIRVFLAEGPRQAINAITLYSVMEANLIPAGAHAPTKGNSSIEQFWQNVQILYSHEKEQAIILSTMLFTFVIWVFSALCLLSACFLYIGFLWHYIPRDDGTLGKYCRRKVNTRLERIVNAKAKDAIAKEEAKRRKAEEKLAGKLDPSMPQPVRQPTLPIISDQDSQPLDPSISRSSSQSSNPPPYASTAGDQNDGLEPKLPHISESIDPPQKIFRTGTESTIASNVSYDPQRTLPRLPLSRPAPGRMDSQSTVTSNVSYGDRTAHRPTQHHNRAPPPRPLRMGSQSTVASNVSYGPPVQSPEDAATFVPPPFGRPAAPSRSYTQSSGYSVSSSASDRPLLNQTPTETPSRNFNRPFHQQEPTGPAYEMSTPRSTSAPPQQQRPSTRPPTSGGYRPYSPANATPQTYRPRPPTNPSQGPQAREPSYGTVFHQGGGKYERY